MQDMLSAHSINPEHSAATTDVAEAVTTLWRSPEEVARSIADYRGNRTCTVRYN